MSFFEKPNLGADPKLSTGPDSNTLDVIGADYEANRVTFNLNAEDIAGEEAYDRVIDQVEELLPGRGKDFANPYRRDPWDMKLDAFGKSLRSPYNPRRLVLENEKDKFWAHYNQIQMDLERYPEAFGLDPNSPERVALPSQDHSRALKSVVDDKLALQADIRSRASGAENLAGGMIGGLGAAGTDPVTYLTAVVPAGLSRTILGATVKGAIANAAIEATLQPAVASWHADLGLDYSLGDATANVAFAALFGGAFEGGGRAIGSAVFGSPDFREAKARLEALPDDHVLRQALSGKREDVIKAGRKLQDALPPEGRRALDLEARAHDAEAALPDRVPPRAHADAINDADIAARDPEMGMPAREAPVPETQTPRYYSEAVPAERGRIYEDDGKPVRTDRFRLAELETDAEAFQYKGGGDTKGVTGRLQGVETWSPLAAGEVMVWERGDGKRFIADGHQRAGLARRLEQNAATRKDPVANSEQQVLDAVTADLERVANATDRKAVQANALLHTAQISTLARRIGMDPKQFYDRHGAKLLEGDAEAGARVLAKTPDQVATPGEHVNAAIDRRVALTRAAFEEAARCVAGLAPSQAGQMVAGGALGLGAGGTFAAVSFYAADDEGRKRRQRAYYEQVLANDPELRARIKWEKDKAAEAEAVAQAEQAALAEEERLKTLYSDIDNMPADNTFDMNSWAETATGVDGGFLDDLIGHEADGDWDAANPESTAVGGGQFIESAWLAEMRKRGPSMGLKINPRSRKKEDRDAILALRTDRRWGTMVTAWHARDNAERMEARFGRNVTQKEAYLAHFLGVDAAIKAIESDPEAFAAVVFPRAAAANANVFFKRGDANQPRTMKEMIARQGANFTDDPVLTDVRYAEMTGVDDGRTDRSQP